MVKPQPRGGSNCLPFLYLWSFQYTVMSNPIKNTVGSRFAIPSWDQLMWEWAAIFVFGTSPQVTLKYQSVCLRKQKHKKAVLFFVFMVYPIYASFIHYCFGH